MGGGGKKYFFDPHWTYQQPKKCIEKIIPPKNPIKSHIGLKHQECIKIFWRQGKALCNSMLKQHPVTMRSCHAVLRCAAQMRSAHINTGEPSVRQNAIQPRFQPKKTPPRGGGEEVYGIPYHRRETYLYVVTTSRYFPTPTVFRRSQISKTDSTLRGRRIWDGICLQYQFYQEFNIRHAYKNNVVN